MEILSSRVLLRPVNLAETQSFYRDVLQLAVSREFGPPEHRGEVFFLGNGLLEVSGQRDPATASSLVLWIQVRDVEAQLERLAGQGVPILREALTEPWGLIEGWIQDPDGTRIVLVQVPEHHPIRRDAREL
ncbi:glyoxalase [Arthrobacter sp. MYb211]|uniref:VOC family protein n=1 Tax=unclassified Arthrobacter TaxID=235627 RepID=UPI000CFB227A|nr:MULTISPECIES: VOC family protein [unclassified Arthrobacter]PRA03011.1 glyoxalase [Arthrobacter sp. MYb229]PRA11026.1 glyoxalase [Arthrobacter sp. MYb221]PRB49481.1 glyoxalase [Arthrobacter sp. MYb216]PRC07181.1 glyoxalase [Arthrobacter sp. MYb211]